MSPDFNLDTEKYTHVIVGFSLWWMKAPWPLLTLFEDKADYDFSKKGIGAFNSNGYAASSCDSNLREVLTGSSFAEPAAFTSSSSEESLRTFAESVLAL